MEAQSAEAGGSSFTFRRFLRAVTDSSTTFIQEGIRRDTSKLLGGSVYMRPARTLETFTANPVGLPLPACPAANQVR